MIKKNLDGKKEPINKKKLVKKEVSNMNKKVKKEIGDKEEPAFNKGNSNKNRYINKEARSKQEFGNKLRVFNSHEINNKHQAYFNRMSNTINQIQSFDLQLKDFNVETKRINKCFKDGINFGIDDNWTRNFDFEKNENRNVLKNERINSIFNDDHHIQNYNSASNIRYKKLNFDDEFPSFDIVHNKSYFNDIPKQNDGNIFNDSSNNGCLLI